MRERVCKPAGMTSARLERRDECRPEQSKLYKTDSDGQLVEDIYTDLSLKYPGGGMTGNAGDLLRFAQAVQDGTLIGAKTFERMLRVPKIKQKRPVPYAFGWIVQDDPDLPCVLLIGDSVSRGYTQSVRKALAGKANVHRAPANCGPTSLGLRKQDVWLGDGKWDVIHFNFGIHDRNTPIAEYGQRLEQLVERMKKTDAKLVWATTTPIPDVPAKKQTAASIVERNEAAAQIMQKHGVVTDDLFTAVTPHLETMQNPNDVHFNAAGYEFLGQQVAKAIEDVLQQ